ncbi:chemotaxis protein CheW [Pirellulaceae bacterium SH501]
MQATEYKLLEVMTFHVGPYEFGLDINGIQEINCHATLKRAPVAFTSVAGVINLRGEVLTVMALGRLLGIESPRSRIFHPKFVVLKNSDERLALMVDEVADVETFPMPSLQSLPANFSMANSHIFAGLIQKPHGLLLILKSSEIPKMGLSSR